MSDRGVTGAAVAEPLSAAIRTRPFLLTWFSTWLIFLGFYLLLPTLPGYFVQLGGHPASAGLLIGWFTVTAMLFRPVGGKLADRWGKPQTMLLGSALLVATMSCYWWVTTPAGLLAVRFSHGIGWAIYLTAAVALISDLAHPTQRASLTGHYFLANTLAMVVGPWLGTLLLAHTNYPLLFTASIGITAVALAFVWPLARWVPPSPSAGSGRWISPGAWYPSLTLLWAAFTYGALLSFLPLCVTGGQVSMFFMVYAIALGLSRPLGGYLADRFGRRRVILPGLLCVGASVSALAWEPHTAGLAAAAAVYGIGFGCVGPALVALAIDRVPARERGVAMAMYAGAFELGLALGSFLLGFVAARWGFPAVWVGAGLAAVVGCAYFALGDRGMNAARTAFR